MKIWDLPIERVSNWQLSWQVNWGLNVYRKSKIFSLSWLMQRLNRDSEKRGTVYHSCWHLVNWRFHYF